MAISVGWWLSSESAVAPSGAISENSQRSQEWFIDAAGDWEIVIALILADRTPGAWANLTINRAAIVFRSRQASLYS